MLAPERLGVERIGPVDIGTMAAWIVAIPFQAWPQQERDELKPAMVTDLAWHRFGELAWAVMLQVMPTFPADAHAYQAMLSVVMPGHNIRPHVDLQRPDWITRVHVPLRSNQQSRFVVGGVAHHLQCGVAYRVNTLIEHGVENDGDTPRIHFMFDVRR